MRRLKLTVMPPVKGIYTAEEARAVLQIGRSAMNNLLQSGAVKSFRVGRRRLIPAQAVTEFIERKMAVAD